MIPPVEIAWWGWLLIWTGLVLAMLVMLGLFAWWLFRKSLRLLDDVSDLVGASTMLELHEPVLARHQIAVLADIRDIREREYARRAHRAARRRQLQERRIGRARRITGVDAALGPWPQDWR